MIEGIPDQAFIFEKEKLDQLDRELGPVMQLSQKTLRAEALGYLGKQDFKIWESIDTDRGRLRDPRLDRRGKASAHSGHSETEVLQAIVYIERWKAARRSAGSRRAAITRKNNKTVMEYLNEKLKQAKRLSEDGITLDLANLRAVIGRDQHLSDKK
ncbi:hypothetical protein ACFL1V_03120 [Pseudomonadota bacterium]